MPAAAFFRTDGAAIRSIVPQENNDGVTWTIDWRAPDEPPAIITFSVAASATSHDESPVGNTIHFRSYALQHDR